MRLGVRLLAKDWKALSLKKLPVESLVKLKVCMGTVGECKGKDHKGESGLVNIYTTSLLKHLEISLGIL